MGLFDMLESAAGIGGQAGGDAGDGSVAPSNAVGAITEMLQSHPGGIGGMVQSFEQSGLGGVAQSWLGQGGNQPISPDQVQQALGDGPVAQVAERLGVSPQEAAGHISQFLPQIMDHLSPGGQAPAGGGFGEIQGLLSRFGGGGQ